MREDCNRQFHDNGGRKRPVVQEGRGSMKKFGISISIQIFIFLIIIAFTPVAIMISLETYEKQQLTMLENSNVQQGRLVAAALETADGANVDRIFAGKLLENMKDRFDSRIRILDEQGRLVADSSSPESSSSFKVSPDSRSTESLVNDYVTDEDSTDTFVYRLFSFPVRVYRKYFNPPRPSYDNADFYAGKDVYDGSEVLAALEGKYGAMTRFSTGGQVSVTLYSAIPVQHDGTVFGVVLVNRSTYRILQNLYELRVDLGRIFLRSLVVVLVIALFLAFRIVRPLRKLSEQAGMCADKKGKVFFTRFTGSGRRDEIGRLSRAFSNLVERLNQRIQFSQAFSSDISHEFKNPLTAIRSSAELLEDNTLDEKQRVELGSAIIDEVSHLQKLLSGIRNISRIDADIASCQEIPANTYIRNIVERFQKSYPEKKVSFASSQDEINISIPSEYLDVAASNLIDNACSFSSEILVTTDFAAEKKEGGQFLLTVEDNGPGLSEEQIGKIFDRFYSERSDETKSSHTGLGLSLVKAVSDSLEGQVCVSKSGTLGGAKFTFCVHAENNTILP